MNLILALVLILLSAACQKPRPEALQEIGHFDTVGWAHDILLDKGKLYIADRQGGFLVFDKYTDWENPAVSAPVADVISLDPHSGSPLLASRFEGVVLLSSAGVVAARYSNGDIANAVVTRGGLAFAAYGLHGLVVMRTSENELRVISQLASPGWSHDVKLLDDWALLADWDYGLRVVDIRDPEQPVEIGALPTPATAIAISPADSGEKRVALAEGHAGVSLVSIDEAGRPTLMGRNDLGLNPKDLPHPAAGGWAHDVCWCGRYVFVANWKRGLAILDARDAARPRTLVEYPCEGTALGVAAVRQPGGEYLVFLADGETGLRVFRFRPE